MPGPPRRAVPVIELPGGEVCPTDDPAAAELLSSMVGQPLVLRREGDAPHHDDCPVHVITTAGLRQLGRLLGAAVDPRRFRANIVLDVDGVDFVEDAWTKRELRLGSDVVLGLTEPMPRCVMVGLPQIGLQRDPRILKELGRVHDVEFGLQAHVIQGGTVREGDIAQLT
ncbi:MAG TPA: MOSC domain-containing protein [Euzebya sp.]|nr:MOSC domain-containing protein [Euzebya sp.]